MINMKEYAKQHYINNRIKKLENSTNINHSIKSSKFTFKNGATETSGCQFAVDNTNNDVLVVVSGSEGNESIVSGGENVGFINYETGTIVFNKFNDSIVSMV